MGHAYRPKSDVSLHKNHHLTGVGNRQGGVNHRLLQRGLHLGILCISVAAWVRTESLRYNVDICLMTLQGGLGLE